MSGRHHREAGVHPARLALATALGPLAGDVVVVPPAAAEPEAAE